MLIYFIYFCVAIFIGSRLRALGNIMHECSHNIFVKSKKWNFIIGQLIALILFDSFTKYRKEHIAHHAYLGNPIKDVDCAHYYKIKAQYFQSSTLNILISVFNPYNWTLNLYSSWFLKEDHTHISFKKIGYIFFLILLSVFQYKIILFAYIVPYCTTYQMFKIFSDIMDHDGLYKNSDINDRSRNHIFAYSILNWLVFPRNDAYHLVHHLYPRLPVRYYPERHKFLLEKNSVYALKNHSCCLQNFSCSGIQD